MKKPFIYNQPGMALKFKPCMESGSVTYWNVSLLLNGQTEWIELLTYKALSNCSRKVLAFAVLLHCSKRK
jgi:hypothetical protein